METVLVLALWLFALTNIDALVVIGAFCADNDYRHWEVLVGHYVSFCLGLAAAVVGTVVAVDLLQEWTFLLGIVPLGLGVWGLVRQPPETTLEDIPAVPNTLGRIGVVTTTGIGISGENIAVYVPFFADLSSGELTLVLGTYLLGAGLVFLAAFLFVSRFVADGIPNRVDRWLVPGVLVVIGGYVLVTGLLVV